MDDRSLTNLLKNADADMGEPGLSSDILAKVLGRIEQERIVRRRKTALGAATLGIVAIAVFTVWQFAGSGARPVPIVAVSESPEASIKELRGQLANLNAEVVRRIELIDQLESIDRRVARLRAVRHDRARLGLLPVDGQLDQTAFVLVHWADQLHRAGMTEQAAEYYGIVAAQFSNTAPAERAAEQLRQLKAQKEQPS
jgi:hypothetical protein